MKITYIGQQTYYNGMRFSEMTLSPAGTRNNKGGEWEINKIIFCPEMSGMPFHKQTVMFSGFQGSSVGTVIVLLSAFQPQAQEQTALVLDETKFRSSSLAPVDSRGILLHRWTDKEFRSGSPGAYKLSCCLYMSISNLTFSVPSSGELTSNTSGT